ncbi:MAG: DNA-binding protein [Mediterranea massiliensis]|nr:DNA-binding protein [Mediterranea massiliensis]
MAVIYKARQAVFANKEGKKLYHPMIVLTGSVKLEQIANDLAELSSLSPGDTYNVVKNLPGVIQRYLANGNSVFLDGLGSFAPTLNNSGNGVEKAEDVTANGARLKIIFRPSAKKNIDGTVSTRALSNGYNFGRMDGVATAPGAEGEPTDPDTGGDSGNGDDVLDPLG